MSTLGSVQSIGGITQFMLDDIMMLAGDIMSTWKIFSTSGFSR